MAPLLANLVVRRAFDAGLAARGDVISPISQ